MVGFPCGQKRACWLTFILLLYLGFSKPLVVKLFGFIQKMNDKSQGFRASRNFDLVLEVVQGALFGKRTARASPLPYGVIELCPHSFNLIFDGIFTKLIFQKIEVGLCELQIEFGRQPVGKMEGNEYMAIRTANIIHPLTLFGNYPLLPNLHPSMP